MKKDIIIAGVGGQGILSIAGTIGYAAVEANLFLKQAEVHGMSQRGGDVQSHFRLSDKPIASDLIPKGKADVIISVEPMEALRYLPMLSPTGWLITNTNPFINIPNYPDIEIVLEAVRNFPNHKALDADSIAKELKSARSANIVVLGAAAPFLDIEQELLENALRTLFGRKGDKVVEANIAALRAGRKFSEEN
ncbi:MAG: indolepyruvate oxidoreductase subunit beta [Candidatus Kapabacteria bacterium]|jgi:indolepyruvate ferredoxin oxidoreductase beta subunit|nr:indolepyruvate oxidoreductase subunit beta [Candidatus Kapabacteria bacterium]